MKIFYFTGTGNSLAIARELNDYLGDQGEVISIADFKKEKEVNIAEDIVGFVFPVYLGDIPWFAKEFILKLEFANDPYIFAVTNCSLADKGGLASISGALVSKGQSLSLGEVIQVHGNCVPLPEFIEQKKVQKIPSKLKQIATRIGQREISYKGKIAEVTPTFVSEVRDKLDYMTKFKVTSNCTGCGLCTQVCPLDNIQVVDERPIHGTNCTECWACFHWCPQKAMRSNVFGLKNRKRYHNPKVTLMDIKRQGNK